MKGKRSAKNMMGTAGPSLSSNNDTLTTGIRIFDEVSPNEIRQGQQSRVRDPARSQLNLNALSRAKLLSECENSLEFIIVSVCRAFDFQNPQEAVRFVAGGINSQYAQCLKDRVNFSRINTFLQLIFTNVKTLIRILEYECDHQNGSHIRIMNLISMGLTRSLDYRIVWQTCILLSGIFQNLNGIQINSGFQTLMIRWAMNVDEEGRFRGPSDENGTKGQALDFIRLCLVARATHSELGHEIIGLFYEVANIGRSKRKWEPGKNDASQLVELFYQILPQYYTNENRHKYFDLMNDILESHHFQIEKDRIDKQHLLFKLVDTCLDALSVINEARRQQQSTRLLAETINSRQSAMSLLCTIWSHHQHIFRHTLQRFLAHFEQVFETAKPGDKSVLRSLKFNYREYSVTTKLGKIALLLLKRNLKDSNKLVKITTVTQMFRLLEQFTRRDELDLQNVVFKLLVLQLLEQMRAEDRQELREVLSNFLAQYLMAHSKEGRAENIAYLVKEIIDYATEQLKLKRPVFTLSDGHLLQALMARAPDVIKLTELLTHTLLSTEHGDLQTNVLAIKLMLQMTSALPESNHRFLQQLMHKSVLALAKMGEKIKQTEDAEVLAGLKIRRHLIIRFVAKTVKKAELRRFGSLKSHVQSFISKYKTSGKGPIAHLSTIINKIGTADDTVSLDPGDNTTSGIGGLENPMMSLKVNSEAVGKLRVIGSFKKPNEQPTDFLNPKNESIDVVSKAHAASVQRDTGANELRPQSTRRFVGDQDTVDLNDQSHQTTLRTEIYTSEDEGEMMKYYIYLSTFKKPIVDGTGKARVRSAKSDEERKDSSERVVTDHSLQQNQSQLRRSNSTSGQSAKGPKLIQDSQMVPHQTIFRTKAQLHKPEDLVTGRRGRRRKLLKRTSSLRLPKTIQQPERRLKRQLSDRGFQNNLKKVKDFISANRESDSPAEISDQIRETEKPLEKKLRVDPNSNYQLKAKYIMENPILEESLEQSGQKQINESLGKNQIPMPGVELKSGGLKKKAESELKKRIDSENSPQVTDGRQLTLDKQSTVQKESERENVVSPSPFPIEVTPEKIKLRKGSQENGPSQFTVKKQPSPIKEEEKFPQVNLKEQSEVRQLNLKKSIEPINEIPSQKNMSAFKSSLADVDKGYSPISPAAQPKLPIPSPTNKQALEPISPISKKRSPEELLEAQKVASLVMIANTPSRKLPEEHVTPKLAGDEEFTPKRSLNGSLTMSKPNILVRPVSRGSRGSYKSYKESPKRVMEDTEQVQKPRPRLPPSLPEQEAKVSPFEGTQPPPVQMERKATINEKHAEKISEKEIQSPETKSLLIPHSPDEHKDSQRVILDSKKASQPLTVDSMNDRVTEDRYQSKSDITKSAVSAANNVRADVSEKSDRSQLATILINQKAGENEKHQTQITQQLQALGFNVQSSEHAEVAVVNDEEGSDSADGVSHFGGAIKRKKAAGLSRKERQRRFLRNAKSFEPDPNESLVRVPETNTPISISRVDSSNSPELKMQSQSKLSSPNTQPQAANQGKVSTDPNDPAYQQFMIGLQQLAMLQQNLQMLMSQLNQLAMLEQQHRQQVHVGVPSHLMYQDQSIRTPSLPGTATPGAMSHAPVVVTEEVKKEPFRHDHRIQKMKEQAKLSTRSMLSHVSQPNLAHLKGLTELSQPLKGRGSFQKTVTPTNLKQAPTDWQKKWQNKQPVKDFSETIKSTKPIGADKLETMSVKANERVKELKRKQEMRRRDSFKSRSSLQLQLSATTSQIDLDRPRPLMMRNTSTPQQAMPPMQAQNQPSLPLPIAMFQAGSAPPMRSYPQMEKSTSMPTQVYPQMNPTGMIPPHIQLQQISPPPGMTSSTIPMSLSTITPMAQSQITGLPSALGMAPQNFAMQPMPMVQQQQQMMNYQMQPHMIQPQSYPQHYQYPAMQQSSTPQAIFTQSNSHPLLPAIPMKQKISMQTQKSRKSYQKTNEESKKPSSSSDAIVKKLKDYQHLKRSIVESSQER